MHYGGEVLLWFPGWLASVMTLLAHQPLLVSSCVTMRMVFDCVDSALYIQLLQYFEQGRVDV